MRKMKNKLLIPIFFVSVGATIGFSIIPFCYWWTMKGNPFTRDVDGLVNLFLSCLSCAALGAIAFGFSEIVRLNRQYKNRIP